MKRRFRFPIGCEPNWTMGSPQPQLIEESCFRRVNKVGRTWGDGMTVKAVWHIVKESARSIGVAKLAPHDLRRTCARLCHASGGELEQIQSFLAHVSAPGTPEKLAESLQRAYPGLRVAVVLSPPFRAPSAAEDEELVAAINAAGCDILWEGLGSPKQDLWMHEHRERLGVPVVIAVGAAFGLNSGMQNRRPCGCANVGWNDSFACAMNPAGSGGATSSMARNSSSGSHWNSRACANTVSASLKRTRAK
jgi:exopolysaccharide biosynthesis WecB/TagA/CpsF family protein